MVALKLKELRKLHQLTQKELAELIGVAQQTVGSWENKRTEPSYEDLRKIAELFNVSTDYLIGAEEIQTPPVTTEETEFITRLRKLNKEQRQTIFDMVNFFNSACGIKNGEVNITGNGNFWNIHGGKQYIK